MISLADKCLAASLWVACAQKLSSPLIRARQTLRIQYRISERDSSYLTDGIDAVVWSFEEFEGIVRRPRRRLSAIRSGCQAEHRLTFEWLL